MKITILVNPIAGGKRLSNVNQAVKAFNTYGINPKIRQTEKRGDAYHFALEEAEKGSDIVVAAGGDGTINEIANGLVNSPVKLGVMPMGVANVLALEMGIPRNQKLAVDTIVNGIPQLVNLGYIRFQEESACQEIGRYFLLMAGIGFDGGVLREIRRAHIESWGKAAYVFTALRLVAKYTHARFTVRINERQEALDAYSAIVGKSRYYGGTCMVTPLASLKDDFLDLCAFQCKGALALLKNACGVLTGRHLNQNGIYYCKAKALEISSEEEVYVQADGDFLGRLPVHLGVRKSALSIMAPG